MKMSDSILPDEGNADDETLSFDEGVSGITNILDPETDPEEKEEATEADEDEDAEDTDEVDEADESEADDETDDDESDAEDDDQEDDSDDEPQFADEDLLVKTADNRTMTVRDLKDYAHKRIAEVRRGTDEKNAELNQRSQTLDQAAQTLAQHRDRVLAWYEQNAPQQPDISQRDIDPVGYYNAMDDYNRRKEEWSQFQAMTEQENQRQSAEVQRQRQEYLAAQTERMFEVMPDLRDKQKLDAFKGDVQKYATEQYGYSPEELASLDDSRALVVIRDAIAYRKLKAQTPKAKESIKGKPKVLRGSKRSNPKAAAQRGKQTRAEQLRKSGSMEAGIAALQDLDL